MRIRVLILSISVLVICSQLAIAQDEDVLGLLRLGRFQSIETKFSNIQAGFEKGLVTEFDLLDMYKVFYQREDNFRIELNAWIKAYPKSPSAYLARGVYFRKLGEFRRGTNYISQIPPEHLSYMQQMFDLAKKDLEMSLHLNPKSYLSVLHLLNIAQFEGNDEAANTYLRLGNSLLPSNFLVRARYLIHLTPRWGGSYQNMEEFIAQCQTEGVDLGQIALLRAIELEDKGVVLAEQGNKGQARSRYLDALRLSISGGSRFRRDYLKASIALCAEPEHRSNEYCQ